MIHDTYALLLSSPSFPTPTDQHETIQPFSHLHIPPTPEAHLQAIGTISRVKNQASRVAAVAYANVPSEERFSECLEPMVLL